MNLGLTLLAKLESWDTKRHALFDLMNSAVAEDDYIQAALYQRDLIMLDKCMAEIRNILKAIKIEESEK